MSEEIDGVPPPKRRYAILAISIGLVITVLNTALANIALPVIAQDLQATPAASVWVINAFQLAVTISLLPFASAGDIFGYRRVYIGGLVIFAVGSLACALSSSLELLVAARVVQGFGAAGVMSINTALVRFIYPRNQLGRGISLVVFLVATSSAAGPSVAAAILAVAEWPWLFMVNVPLAMVTLAFSIYALPHTGGSPHRFDVASAVLSALAFGFLIYGIDAIGHTGDPLVVGGALLIAVLTGTLLVRRELRSAMPLLPVDLFAKPVFALSAATAALSFAAQALAFVSLPFYFHDVIGRTQVETGLLMTAWPLSVAVVAPAITRLVDRYPAGILASVGLVSMAGGLALLGLLPAAPTNADIVWRMVLCGFGFGLFQATNSRTLISSASPERSGAASGIISTARLLGQAIGTALVAVIFSLLASRGNPLAGTEAATLAGAGFALAAAVASALRLIDFQRAASTDDSDRR